MEFITTDLWLDLIVMLMNSLWTFLQSAVWLDGSDVQTSEVIQEQGQLVSANLLQPVQH